MKEIHRSRRIIRQLHQGLTSDEDESDGDHLNLGRINKNANRTGLVTLIDTRANQQSSSDQSSLHLYSISSNIPKKAATMSDDLTPLTSSATPLTPLTTSMHSKQTEGTTVQIDLTLLSSTDTLASSAITLSQTNASMKSIVFNRENPNPSELVSFRKNISLPTINDTRDQDEHSVLPSMNICLNHSQRKPVRWSPRRWSFDLGKNRLKFFIGCTTIGFIVGVILLILIL